MASLRFPFAFIFCLWFGLTSCAYGESLSVGYLAYGQSFDVTNHGSNEGGGAGLFTLSYVETLGSTFVQVTPGTIASFCIDLNEYIYPSAPAGPNHYDIISLADAPNYASGSAPMGTAKANAIARLWRMYVNADANEFVDDPVNASTKNAALQLAIWEIEFEDWNSSYAGPDPWDLTSGNFVSNSLTAAILQANAMLDWVWDNPHAVKAHLEALSAPTLENPSAYQDQVVELTPVPEPAALISLATIVAAAAISLGMKKCRRPD